MNNTEEQHPVFIPRNFIEKGTFMGGMFKIRNAIEGGVLAILITIPVINLPLTLTVRIITVSYTHLDVYKRQLSYRCPNLAHFCDLQENLPMLK